MRPIADAVTEIQVQTGSTSAEYGSYLGVHINVVTKSGTNTPHGSLFDFFQDDALDARGYFENRALPKNPRKRNQFGAQIDGPVVIPRLYDGRNKTFFMGAYEGVRGEALTSPFASVPTALMRQGNFSEITTPIRNPLHRPAVPRQHHPAVACCRRWRWSCSSTTRRRTGPGTANNLQAPSATTDNVDQVLMRVDQNLGNKVRLSVRYNWHDSFNSNIFNAAIPVTAVTQPRVNKNSLFAYTHTLRPNLHNDFRIGYHRIDFDTLNHVRGRRACRRRRRPGHSRLRRRRRDTTIPACRASTSATSAGSAPAAPTGTSSTRRSRCRTCSPTRAARTTSGPASTCGGWRPAGARPTIRAGCSRFTGDITGYSVADFMLGLPRTVIPPTDQIQGHVGGWRNGFFVNDVWQAVAQPDAEPRPALRAEHAGADLRRTGLDARPRTSRRSSRRRFPSKGFKFHEPNNKDIAPAARRHLSPRREDRAARRLRDLLQPEPDELVHVPDQQPAAGGGDDVTRRTRPTRRCRSPVPIGGGRPGGTAGHDLADPRSAQRAQGPVELRPPARAVARAPRSTCSTSARTPATWIAASSTTRRSPGAGAVDPRRPEPEVPRAAASSRTT